MNFNNVLLSHIAPVPSSGLRNAIWITRGDALSLELSTDTLAEVSLNNICMKEPVAVKIFLPHEHRDSEMRPIEYNVSNSKDAKASAEKLLSFSGVYGKLLTGYDAKRARQRVDMFLERMATENDLDVTYSQTLQDRALLKLDGILNNELVVDPDDATLPTVSSIKTLRQQLKIAKTNPDIDTDAATQEIQRLIKRNSDTRKKILEGTDTNYILQTVHTSGRCWVIEEDTFRYQFLNQPATMTEFIDEEEEEDFFDEEQEE